MAAAPSSGNLYVGGLHPDVTDRILFDVFQACGPVASVRICRDVQTRRSLGYAFVNYHNIDDAQRAIDTKFVIPHEGGSSTCRITWSQRDPTLRNMLSNVFVKNLSKETVIETLRDTFSVFGSVLHCKIMTGVENESLGYGFVSFQDKEAANSAVEKVNGTSVDGQVITVMHLQEKKERGFTNVFVKNLPVEWSNEDLKTLCSPFGTINSLFFPVEKEKTKGFAFVNFSTRQEADVCIAKLNNTSVNDKILVVRRAERATDRLQRLQRLQRSLAVSVNVTNIPVEWTADDLKAHFSPFGAITNVFIPDDEKERGQGCVTFTSSKAAAASIEKMNNTTVKDKTLVVALAAKKAEEDLAPFEKKTEEKALEEEPEQEQDMDLLPPEEETEQDLTDLSKSFDEMKSGFDSAS